MGASLRNASRRCEGVSLTVVVHQADFNHFALRALEENMTSISLLAVHLLEAPGLRGTFSQLQLAKSAANLLTCSEDHVRPLLAVSLFAQV